MRQVLIIIVGVTLVLVLVVIAISVKQPYIPPPPKIRVIDPKSGATRSKMCLVTKESCSSDADCTGCVEGNLTCQDLSITKSAEEKVTGTSSGKFCLPAVPALTCDKTKGGVLLWSGYSGSERMSFECACAHPDYYSEHGCSQLNPHICAGGVYSYTDPNLPPDLKPAGAGSCQCPAGSVPYERNLDNTPFCVKKELTPLTENPLRFYGYFPYDRSPEVSTLSGYKCDGNKQCVKCNPVREAGCIYQTQQDCRC